MTLIHKQCTNCKSVTYGGITKIYENQHQKISFNILYWEDYSPAVQIPCKQFSKALIFIHLKMMGQHKDTCKCVFSTDTIYKV